MFASSSSHRRLHLGATSGRNIPKLWYILEQHVHDIVMEEGFRLYQLF